MCTGLERHGGAPRTKTGQRETGTPKGCNEPYYYRLAELRLSPPPVVSRLRSVQQPVPKVVPDTQPAHPQHLRVAPRNSEAAKSLSQTGEQIQPKSSCKRPPQSKTAEWFGYLHPCELLA